MIFYNQPGTPDGSVVHVGKVIGHGRGSDDASVDIGLFSDDVMGLVVAASTDGAPFEEVNELEWCVLSHTQQQLTTYRARGLTTERALVLGELYRRSGGWRLRAVGQGWQGGLADLATDYGVSIANDDAPTADTEDEFDVSESAAPVAVAEAVAADVVPEDGEAGSAGLSDGGVGRAAAEVVQSATPAKAQNRAAGASPAQGTGRVRIAPVKSAAVPIMRLAEDPAWQPSRLFSISGIGGLDEQEKRATSALLWTMSAVRPLGRALTARATDAGRNRASWNDHRNHCFVARGTRRRASAGEPGRHAETGQRSGRAGRHAPASAASPPACRR